MDIHELIHNPTAGPMDGLPSSSSSSSPRDVTAVGGSGSSPAAQAEVENAPLSNNAAKCNMGACLWVSGFEVAPADAGAAGSMSKQRALLEATAATERAHKESIFYWISGGKLPLGISASRFVAELLSVLWFCAGMYSIQASLTEMLIPANSLPSLLLQQTVFGRAATAHMSAMGIYALHTLDTKCDDILQVGQPSAFRRWWWASTRKRCGCSISSSDAWLDWARHWKMGLGLYAASKLLESTAILCSSGVITTAGTEEAHPLCGQPLIGARLLSIAALGLFTVLFAWCARTHVLQASLTRMVTIIIICTSVAGYPLVALVPPELIGLGNVFLVGMVWGLVLPAAVYIFMLYEDSSRVDALTQFLQYMSHQVRGPSTSAGLALRQVQHELADMKLFMSGFLHAADQDAQVQAAMLKVPAEHCVGGSDTGSKHSMLSHVHGTGSVHSIGAASAPAAVLAPELPPWLLPTSDLPFITPSRIIRSASDSALCVQGAAGAVRHNAVQHRSILLPPIMLPPDPEESDPDTAESPLPPLRANNNGKAPVARGSSTMAWGGSTGEPKAATSAPWLFSTEASAGVASSSLNRPSVPAGTQATQLSSQEDVFDEGGLKPLASQIVDGPLPRFVHACVTRLRDMAAAARGAGASLSAVKALLDRTLDLARLEAGHGSVRPSRFQVGALWSDVVRAVAPAYRESGVRLHFKVGDVTVTADSRVAFPDMWRSQGAAAAWVLGDRLRLHQSLVAILENGAVYTPAGGHVRVSLELVSDAEQQRGTGVPRPAAQLHGAGKAPAVAHAGHTVVGIDDSAKGGAAHTSGGGG